MPAITNDAPPMNEAIHDGVNGVLVGSTPNGTREVGDSGARSGRRRAERRDRAARRRRACARELAAGAVRVRDTERRWDDTVEGIGDPPERVA